MPPWWIARQQPILDYNCDMLSAEAFLEAAGESRNLQCVVHYFIAMTLLAEGNRAEAADAADVVFSMVGFPPDVEEVHLGPQGTMVAPMCCRRGITLSTCSASPKSQTRAPTTFKCAMEQLFNAFWLSRSA